MFKAARWRSDKNKIKAVFKFQFQATQVPLSGAEAVTVSLVPLDVGKLTVRSERVSAVGGTCNWSDPIYETVKLVRDPKSGNINEKFYKFLVSAAGPARAGLLGEATINLADYVEVSKASVSLPLKAGALLHVTIQKIQGDVGGREAEGNGDATLRRKGTPLQSQLSKCDDEEGDQRLNEKNEMNLVKDGSDFNRETRLNFQSSRNLPTYADPSYSLQKSHSFDDAISATSSDSSSELYTLRENSDHNGCIQKDLPILLSPPANICIRAKLLTSSGDLSGISVPDRSIDGSTNSSGESGLTEKVQSSGDTLENLRNEVAFLTRNFQVSELELQTLRKQVVKENRRGQHLSKEVSSLKEDRDALLRECEELKLSQVRTNESESEMEDPLSMLEEIKQELDHEKNVNLSLRLQLQKTQEANSALLLAVRDLDELLDQKNRETACLGCSKIDVKTKDGEDLQGMESGNGFLKLQQSECKEQLLEQTFDTDEAQYTLGALVNEHSHMLAYSLEKIIDRNNEIDLYKKEREELEMQMEQLALDYEILKQENHDVSTVLEQTQLREQLRMQYECSAHTAIISDLETHVESLEKELQTHAESFELDISSTMKDKIEQEKKALLADEALRKTKWNYVNIAERLQEELTRLSSQASSLFHDNEKIVKQALREASELRLHRTHLEKMLEETKENLTSSQNQYQKNLQLLIRLLDFKSKEEDRLKLELKNKSGELDDYKKFQEAKLKHSLEKIQVLETEIEKLKMNKCLISGQKENLEAEIEILETTNRGNKMMLQEKKLENEVLKKEITLLKQEVEKSLDEIKDLKCTGDEKVNMIIQLNMEVETLGQQFNNLQQSLTKGEQEKEKLRRLVSNLTGGLLKEEDIIIRPEAEVGNSYSNEEKHYHKRSGRAGTNEFEVDVAFLRPRGDQEQINDTSDKTLELATRYPETHSEEQGIVTCKCDQNKVAKIYSKMALLKEQHEQMEADLKEMQERYSEISLKFAEVEGERQQLVMTIRTLKNALKN